MPTLAVSSRVRQEAHINRVFYGALALLLLGALGDATTSTIAITGGMVESDPVNRARIEQYGLAWAIALYLALGLAFALICLLLWRVSFAAARRWPWFASYLRFLRVAFIGMVGLIAMQRLGITLWNIYVLTRFFSA